MMGFRISATSEATILPKAPPIITPMARSRTFPRMMKVLNSLNMLAAPGLFQRCRPVYTGSMAKNTPLIKVTCPCCQAELHIDSETSAVIRHVEHVKPPTFADLESAVQRQRGEAGRRE